MSKWKLYWVYSDGVEDCFVVAKNSRSAKRVEKDMNGFLDDEVGVIRVMDVPDKYEKIANEKFRKWSLKNNYNTHLDIETLTAWPYYAEDWLLLKLGAEIRYIEGEREVLIDDMVYSPSSVRPVGIKVMRDLYELSGDKFLDVTNVSYEGIEEAIETMLGKSVTLTHEIENYITNSFIFGVGNEKFADYTISELTKYWKKKFTFGKLIKLMEENFIIQEDVRNSLELFLTQRNLIAHGLTTEERYDITTLWGQKETVGYLAVFLRNAVLLRDITESAYLASINLGYYLMSNDKTMWNSKVKKEKEAFENDPYVQEKLSLFISSFEMKKNKIRN